MELSVFLPTISRPCLCELWACSAFVDELFYISGIFLVATLTKNHPDSLALMINYD